MPNFGLDPACLDPRRLAIRLVLFLLFLALLLGGPLGLAVARAREASHWSVARWDSAGIAPDAASHPEAIVQVYAARSWGWKGAVAVHSWIVLKPEGGPYERYDVVGWGVTPGGTRPSIRRDMRPIDGYWAGNRPTLVGDVRGPEAAAAIPKLRAAIQAYAYGTTYRLFPGPNSNTFTASLLRAAPELGIAMPAHAVGKDWLPLTRPLARTPSGTGFQLSLFGLAGVMLAVEEGIEVNVLGLTLGIDPKHLSLKLPGLGSIGPGSLQAGAGSGYKVGTPREAEG